MKRNISEIDKRARILFALVVIVLYSMDIISGTLALVLGVVGVVLLITAFLNFCPIWAALGINTFKKKEE